MKQWYSLTHHVTSHQRTVTIIMLQEWNQTCGYRSNLLWRDVNIINLIRTNNRIISILTTLYYITNERTINSQRRITLTDNIRLFIFSSQVYNILISHIDLAIIHLTVRSNNLIYKWLSRPGRATAAARQKGEHISENRFVISLKECL